MKGSFIMVLLLCAPLLAQVADNDPAARGPVVFGLKIFMAVMCGSFMILTAITFLRFRLRKKAREYQHLLDLFHIEERAGHTPTVEGEFSGSDYILPVGFATSICVFYFGVIFSGRDWENQMADSGSIIILGMGETFIQPAVLSISYAFLGAFLWSANNITRRLISADLSPGIYYATGLRILFATMVSLILAAILHSSPWDGFSQGLLPGTAFLTGMLPDQALRYVKERVRIFSRAEKEASHPLGLEMVEGINLFHKARLSEIGIDNAQNLAEANLIELLLKTPFSPRQILDWIAQAKLFVFVTDAVNPLRKVGIRTVFDLYQVEDGRKLVEEVSQETGVSQLLLTNTLKKIHQDPDIAGLWHMQQRLTIPLAAN